LRGWEEKWADSGGCLIKTSRETSCTPSGQPFDVLRKLLDDKGKGIKAKNAATNVASWNMFEGDMAMSSTLLYFGVEVETM